MLRNLINGKIYVGSSENLFNRLSFYYSPVKMKSALKQGKSHICSALFKHGHSSFSLSILEYCDPDKCIEREKYFIHSLQSEYNIIRDPTLPPMSGRTHSEESKIIMSNAAKKSYNSGRFKTAVNHPNYGKSKVAGSGRLPQQIEVTDIKNNTTTTYDSISVAARTLNIDLRRISEYFTNNQQKPYKGQYTFKKL